MAIHVYIDYNISNTLFNQVLTIVGDNGGVVVNGWGLVKPRVHGALDIFKRLLVHRSC